jgi:hypothetical protein
MEGTGTAVLVRSMAEGVVAAAVGIVEVHLYEPGAGYGRAVIPEE